MNSDLTYDTVVPRLFQSIPILESKYEAEFDYMLEEPPLAYLVFGIILIPALQGAIDDGDDRLANLIGLFLEDVALASKSDAKLADLLKIEVGEWLGGTTRKTRAAEFLGTETKRILRLATQRHRLRAERDNLSFGRRSYQFWTTFISIIEGCWKIKDER